MAAVAGVVIVAAVIVGLTQLALPWLAQHPQHVERFLAERLGREVKLGRVEGLWTRSGPRLILDNLEIAAGAPDAAPLKLEHAELALNLYAAFQRNRAWNEFRLVGLDLGLLRDASGVWQLRGIELGDRSQADSSSMGALGAIVLVDLKLEIIDPSRNIDLSLLVPELRVVNLGETTRVLGYLGSAKTEASRMSLVADIDLHNRSGQVYVGGRALDLAELGAGQSLAGISTPGGHGDVEIWARWNQGRIDDMHARIDLRDSIFAANRALKAEDAVEVMPRASFERFALSARWLRQGEGWTLDVADASVTHDGAVQPPARVHMEKSDSEVAQFSLSANAIDLDTLGSMLMLGDDVPDTLRRWLYLSHPQGSIAAIESRWSSAQDFDLDMLIDRFSSSRVDRIPGIESLSARLRGDAQGVVLELPMQATRVDYAPVFRQSFELSRFGGDIVAWRDDDGWRVGTPGIEIQGSGYALQASGQIEFQTDGTKPLLDMSAVVTSADVVAAKMFWPMTTMPPSSVSWLDRALVDGRIVEGRVVFRGDLDAWPFNDNSGRFEARADLEGLDLAYLPDWPHGEQLDVVARFINNGMRATVSSGKSMELGIDSAEATIASFGDSVLDLSAKSHGDGRAMLDFLRATPIGKQHASTLAGLSIGGKGSATFNLNVPLKDDDKLKLDGSVDLVDADLSEKDWDIHFKKANGRVRFDRGGVGAEALAVLLEGRPARLGIFIGDFARDRRHSFEATLNATLPVATVFARAPDIAAAFPYFPGEADWQIGLDLGDDEGPLKGLRRLRIDSDLRGISIELPRPLAKAADLAWPLSIGIDIPPLGQPFTLDLGDVLSVRGRLPAPGVPLAAHINLGAVSTAAPPASGVYIGGRTATLDVGGWAGLLAAGEGAGDLFSGLSIDVGDLEIASRSFRDTHVELAPDKDKMVVRLAGSALDGEITIPTDDLRRSGVTARMNRVHWPDLPAEKEASPEALAGVAPSSIPPLHLWIGELRVGSAKFGDMRLESFPIANGMRIDLLETKSPNVDMRATGEWTGGAGDNRSQLAIDMTAHNLGQMLDAFGFAGIIDGGQTLAHINAAWPGAPTAFALANMTGSLEISVDKGRILDVDPGAGGRLFGLLSLREIPRRLSLDFSDLFKSGMSFNAISGKFTLHGGNAYTDDLHINSPAADIRISGRTGLRDRNYDQQMSVTPRAGVALPVVGALAGGPVGAAAGLVVQGLIGKQINEVARSVYNVTGTWEKPVIMLQGTETAKPPARGKSETKRADSAAESLEKTLPTKNSSGEPTRPDDAG